MATLPDLEIAIRDDSDNTATFHPFPRLPSELRIRIWELSLPWSYRFFEFAFQTPPGGDPKPHFWAPAASPEKAAASVARLLKIDCTPTVSRDVALRFLRVHLPCRLPRNPKPKPNEDNTDFFKSEFKCAGRGWAHLSTRSDLKFIFDPAAVPSTLYLNPDLDFVYFNHRRPSPERAMAVVHEIRARDPLGVGVCNLALDELFFAWERQGRDYIPEAWCAAVRACLTRLREVIWMTHCSGDGSSGGRNAGSNLMPWYRARGYRLPRHERSLPVGGFWHHLLTGWGVKREQAPGERSFRLMRVFPGWERKMDKLLQQTDDE